MKEEGNGEEVQQQIKARATKWRWKRRCWRGGSKLWAKTGQQSEGSRGKVEYATSCEPRLRNAGKVEKGRERAMGSGKRTGGG